MIAAMIWCMSRRGVPFGSDSLVDSTTTQYKTALTGVGLMRRASSAASFAL
jgi:hypothetical protein